ncbi:MAG: hypothetical protein H7323_13160, partial [Frankiales bacterium]|nr:hypothetical protein [Frankiales bacterium]
MTVTRGRSLSLAAWAGLLCGGGVLTATGTALVALEGLGGASPRQALAVGTAAGLLLSVLAVIAAARLAGALRGLQSDAVRRL